jgi:tetratricopeptide (TPR) repeat protein
VVALQNADLINEKRHLPELEYIFKHALIQEAAYDSILTERRRVLHQKVGQCLEQIFSDRLEELYPVVAYHYAKAEDWNKAQEYLFKAGDRAGSIAADAEALEHYRKAVATYDQEFKGDRDPIQQASIDRKIGEALFRTGHHDLAHSHLERAAQYLGSPYPASPRAVQLAVLKELLREGAVNLSKRLFSQRKAPVALTARNAELSRIWTAMGWIDFFLNGERLFLDVLLLKRAAEGNPHSAEFVTSLAYIGLVFDVFGSYGLAARYHLEAMRRALEADNSLALALCYLFRGMHDYHVGEWDAALKNYRQSASTYWATGNLRYWGAAISMSLIALLAKGDTEYVAMGKEQLRVAGETQDQQLRGWARCGGIGRVYARQGANDNAVIEFEKAARHLELVPDYLVFAWSLAERAACHLRQGQLDRALDAVERSVQLIKDHRLRGYGITRPMMVRAEVYLVASEQASGVERKVMLKVAAKACKAAAKQGRTVRDDGAPDSLRLCGIYAWITGDRKKAQRLWNQSIEVAEKLGAKYVLAQTNLEIGKRVISRPHLVLAEALFIETDAQADLSIVQQLLRDSA